MPESPDFDQIAARLAQTVGAIYETTAIAEQLRLVWNARPVPRCDQCRFWHRDRVTPDQTGDCRVFSDDPNIAPHRLWPVVENMPKPLACVAPFAGADSGSFITEADFGCVQWEAKR